MKSYILIIRATHSAQHQRAALGELWRRGLWLHDGANGGDDQQAAAIRLAGYGADLLASKEARGATLLEMGYGP